MPEEILSSIPGGNPEGILREIPAKFWKNPWENSPWRTPGRMPEGMPDKIWWRIPRKFPDGMIDALIWELFTEGFRKEISE